MPQPSAFIRHFAHLVHALVHRADAVAEQKEIMRNVMVEARGSEHEGVLTDLNMSVAEATRLNPPPEELNWLVELSTRMAAHSVRIFHVPASPSAADVLGVARALASPPVQGDDGAAFDEKLVALSLTSITVQLGRAGFVRHATPIAMRTVGGPARTPPMGTRAVDVPHARFASPSPLRLPTPPPQLLPKVWPVARRPQDAAKGEAKGAANGAAALADETDQMMETQLMSSGARDVEQLFTRIANSVDADAALRALEDAVRTAESRAAEGMWIEVVQIMRRLLGLEETLEDPDRRRAALIAMRRLNKPGYLRGIAQLLPRRRELRDDISLVLSRAGDPGSDVLVDLLVGTESTPERRAYRMALAHCPSAVPALQHLLGDARWFVVRNAAELLGEMGITEADAKLAHSLKHADARVRRAAAGALGRLATSRSVHALIQALEDRVPAVRLQAAIGLGAVRNPRAVPAIVEALDKEDDPEVQGALLGALGSLPSDGAVERLIRAAEPGGVLNRRPTAYRLHALQALRDAGTHAALSALRGFLKDRDKEVREKAERLIAHQSQEV